MRQSILLLIASAALAAQAAEPTTPSPQKNQRAAPPTKWDSRVTDTFFPDARALLTGPRPESLTAAMTGAGKTAKNGAAANQTAARPGPTTDAGEFAWSKLISTDTLQDEIKSLQPLLADDVKTQQAFLGGAFKKSRRTLSLLAATFAIVNEYDGDVKWKAQAAAERDLFARAGYNCKAATDLTFREARQCSENLSALLRGEAPPATSAEAANEWAKIADLLPLMSRLELAQRDRMARWTASSGEFKKNAAALRHEAELVAALAEAIARPGMENADDEKFHSYANDLKQSALDLQSAVKSDNYPDARTAAGTLSKACANCHNDFR